MRWFLMLLATFLSYETDLPSSQTGSPLSGPIPFLMRTSHRLGEGWPAVALDFFSGCGAGAGEMPASSLRAKQRKSGSSIPAGNHQKSLVIQEVLFFPWACKL